MIQTATLAAAVFLGAMPDVLVQLDGPIEKIEGVNWPRDTNGYSGIALVDNACQIKILFPNRQFLQCYSRVVFLSQEGGFLREVDVMPTKEPVAYKDALEITKRMLSALKVPMDSSLWSKVERWYAISEEPRVDRNAREFLAEDIAARMVISYDSDANGWSVLFELTVPSRFDLPTKSQKG